MPRVAMDFSKTVIYHFVCKDEMIKCSYVGSTTNFVKRKATHKHGCCIETAKTHNYKLYQTIRENGGWTNWDIKPLEEFPCENKTQQIIREQFWIDKLKPEMNCKLAYREGANAYEKHKSWREENKEVLKEKQKDYRKENQESIKERKKAYYDTNAEVIKERRKPYYEANSETIKEKVKVWREANRDRVNENSRNIRKLKKEQQETEQ